jgi:hypothetical protein
MPKVYLYKAPAHRPKLAIAAAVALDKAGAGKAVVIAVCLSTVFAVHIAPAAIGLLALFVAALLRERSTHRGPQRIKARVFPEPCRLLP